MKHEYNQKELWRKTWDDEKHKKVNAFAKRSLAIIEKHGNLKTLLDLGCGLGQDSAYFAKKDFQVTAVDFSETGVRGIPKDIKNLKPVCQDINNLKFKHDSFDIIYANLSLHYFDDSATTKIFDKLYDILKKDGLIFIKCKSTDDAVYGKGGKIAPDVYFFEGRVCHFFSKEYMKSKLAKFHVMKIRKTASLYHKYKSSFIEAVAMKNKNYEKTV
ncbi:MAG: class I SAM-dependent methyltransferase [Candidatus Moraniibacteriota bacterium]